MPIKITTIALDEAVRDTVDKRLIDLRIRKAEAPAHLGMSQSTYYAKLRDPGSIKLRDIRRMRERLKLSKEDIMSWICKEVE